MVNQNFSVASAVLNDKAIHYVDTFYEETTSSFNGDVVKTTYPRRLQLINSTGVEIFINIFSSNEEYLDSLVNPTKYQLFSIANNEKQIWNPVNVMPYAYKIAVQAPDAGTSAAFRIQCIGYAEKK